METTKDRATEYWDNEIKRAAENTAKALAEYEQANKEEKQALDRKNDAEVNQVAEETKEEAREIHRQKSLISSQKWEAFLTVSKWECITREAAESYKKRKAEKEANNMVKSMEIITEREGEYIDRIDHMLFLDDCEPSLTERMADPHCVYKPRNRGLKDRQVAYECRQEIRRIVYEIQHGKPFRLRDVLEEMDRLYQKAESRSCRI